MHIIQTIVICRGTLCVCFATQRYKREENQTYLPGIKLFFRFHDTWSGYISQIQTQRAHRARTTVFFCNRCNIHRCLISACMHAHAAKISTLTQKLWRYILSSFHHQRAFNVVCFFNVFLCYQTKLIKFQQNSLLDYYHIIMSI